MHDMDFSDNLIAIARAGAGVNNIPVDRCTEEGIAVFNTPGANANGVKELVIAGMLLSSRDIVGGIDWVVENAENEDISAMTEKEKKKSRFALPSTARSWVVARRAAKRRRSSWLPGARWPDCSGAGSEAPGRAPCMCKKSAASPDDPAGSPILEQRCSAGRTKASGRTSPVSVFQCCRAAG